MKTLKLSASFFVCFLFAGPLAAQYPYYKNFTINDGLVSNKVYNITEDRNGFIWICSDQGVSRFDGVDFVNFTSNDGLPDNDILSIYEDGKGRIWFNSFSTEPGYYYRGKIYHAGNDSFLYRLKQNKPEGQYMNMIVQDNHSLAFLINCKGGEMIVGKDIQDVKVVGTGNFRSHSFQNFLIRNKTGYHLVTPFEILAWEQGDSIRDIHLNIWRLGYTYNQVPKDRLFGLNRHNMPVTLYDIDLKTFKKTTRLIDDKYNFLFVNGTSHILTGDSFYTLFDASFSTVLQHYKMPFAFENIFIDRKGNKWFGSSDHGIYLARKYAPVSMHLPDPWKNGILGVKVFGNNLLLRTEQNGLLSVDTQGNCRRLFNHPVNKRIRGVAHSGKYFLVGTDKGIFKLRNDFLNPSLILSNIAVKDMEMDCDNEVLIGTGFHAYSYSADSISVIVDERTTSICRFDKSKIWLGGLKGVRESIYTDGTYTIKKLKLNHELDNSRIVDIQKDKRGNMWVATDQKGIFFCPLIGETLRFCASSPHELQLLSDICLQIVIAEDGSIWLATMNGISVVRYVYRDMKPLFLVQNYSISEGMPDKTITGLAFWNGKVVVATPNGLYRFDDFPILSPVTSETLITQVNVNGKTWIAEKLVLPYDENNLIISYASSFVNTGGTYLFRYRVKELNKNWIETKTLQVSLLGLKSGTYTFEIASVNSLGKSGPVNTIHFTINSPWFRQWWFVLIVSSIFLFSIIYYLKLLREKLLMGKNLTLLRLRILRAQMNPHFVFNALSNVQRLIQIKELNDANNYIGTLASIMRKSIDYSQKEFIALDREVEYTKNYLEIEKLRFDDRFEYNVFVHFSTHEAENIFVPPLLLQPLVENTIKHAFRGVSYKGALSVDIYRVGDNSIRYIIKDNGCGFDTTNVSIDHGLGIAKERVELVYKNMGLQGYFNITSHTVQPDNGTIITIELPILKD